MRKNDVTCGLIKASVKCDIFGSGDDVCPFGQQAITWTNADI